jgi:hypothetical protein
LIFRTNSSNLNEIVIPPVPGAQRDLLFLFTSHIANSQGGGYLKLCHPERTPDFLLNRTNQRPRMRLSLGKAARGLPTPLSLTGNPEEAEGSAVRLSPKQRPLHVSAQLSPRSCFFPSGLSSMQSLTTGLVRSQQSSRPTMCASALAGGLCLAERRTADHYFAVQPPSMIRSLPVMKPAKSEQR